MKKYISFSQIKNWVKCPFYHKLASIDKVDGAFSGNIYTAFGSALHETIENHLEKKIEDDDLKAFFSDIFNREKDSLEEEIRDSDYNKFLLQGELLVEKYKKALDSYFGGNYEIVSCEEEIYEEINDFLLDKYHFKGYIDLVVKVGDTYHIIDWKTCSWGWDARRRSDTNTTYQLVFYKYYYAIKHNIDPKNIKCHFGLLKRTAKKDHVEIFEVTSGPRRTKNAIELLQKALTNINKKNYIKNRLSCDKCEFKGTKHCP